nr:MAG TPA: hypothetical protein [Caudoviricetes sp.]
MRRRRDSILLSRRKAGENFLIFGFFVYLACFQYLCASDNVGRVAL